MSALPTNRESLSMSQASVGTKIHQSLDIQANLTLEIPFNSQILFDVFSDTINIAIRKIFRLDRFLNF
jgi:hypothetical protein